MQLHLFSAKELHTLRDVSLAILIKVIFLYIYMEVSDEFDKEENSEQTGSRSTHTEGNIT